jgi:hypothetical protein
MKPKAKRHRWRVIQSPSLERYHIWPGKGKCIVIYSKFREPLQELCDIANSSRIETKH